ncbi:MAG TPA: UvrB/UvrC motif-containing protein [Gemmatales bacterium]|nr:UvrB/UvrC motif-containing protein [Gemmatales bacterium]HMP59166.1 UvrB/UvrC motif-containing protein [Gemmatales bacterium]
MRCQRCPKSAHIHITDIHGANADGAYMFDEYHFCEDCAQKFLFESATGKSAEAKPETDPEATELSDLNQRTCPNCGITFKDFRLTGRLGCPQDYEVFRADLMPLLENIHGEVQHVGKAPRRQPASANRSRELTALRKQLQQAVGREDYEEAARLRDRIRQVEQQSD